MKWPLPGRHRRQASQDRPPEPPQEDEPGPSSGSGHGNQRASGQVAPPAPTTPTVQHAYLAPPIYAPFGPAMNGQVHGPVPFVLQNGVLRPAYDPQAAREAWEMHMVRQRMHMVSFTATASC